MNKTVCDMCFRKNAVPVILRTGEQVHDGYDRYVNDHITIDLCINCLASYVGILVNGRYKNNDGNLVYYLDNEARKKFIELLSKKGKEHD